jgi:hypothetical protein
MGIGRGAVAVLLAESARRPLAGQVLVLGRQVVFPSPRDIVRLGRRFGRRLVIPEHDGVVLPSGRMSDRMLLSMLGFSDVTALDASPFEGAELVHDLNQPIGPDHRGRYDLVLDSGTIEHVFDQRAALANIHAALRTDGRVVHISPTHNYLDHGFYTFSPTFFADWYQTNGWRIERLALIRHGRDPDDAWQISAYPPAGLEPRAGRLDGAMYATLCIATKLAVSTGDRVPTQGAYRQRWGLTRSDPPVAVHPEGSGSRPGADDAARPETPARADPERQPWNPRRTWRRVLFEALPRPARTAIRALRDRDRPGLGLPTDVVY